MATKLIRDLEETEDLSTLYRQASRLTSDGILRHKLEGLAAEEARDSQTIRATMKKIRPLQDRILVKRLEEKETKKGGIIIPDTAKEKPQEGQVIAVGPGKLDEHGKRIPMEVKAGDKILFGKYSGSEVKVADEEHLIMREEDVLGILE
jgi:chaperonin GroES